MRRHHLSLVLLLVPITTSAAPAPKDRLALAPLYFATTAGTELEYERRGKRGTLVVSDITEVGDGKVVTISSGIGKMKKVYQVVTVSSAGVDELQFGSFLHDPPICLLRVPVKESASWETDIPAQAGLIPAKLQSTVSGPERVKVPAGTFFALRVDSDYVEGGKQGLMTEWYALGVGLVKWKNGDDEKVLVSFKAGK